MILVPGPEEEIRVVRWTFEAFVNEGKRATEIGRLLNQRGILSPSGRPWTEVKIRNLLRNENYVGNLVYARRSMKLMGKCRQRDRRLVLVCPPESREDPEPDPGGATGSQQRKNP